MNRRKRDKKILTQFHVSYSSRSISKCNKDYCWQLLKCTVLDRCWDFLTNIQQIEKWNVQSLHKNSDTLWQFNMTHSLSRNVGFGKEQCTLVLLDHQTPSAHSWKLDYVAGKPWRYHCSILFYMILFLLQFNIQTGHPRRVSFLSIQCPNTGDCFSWNVSTQLLQLLS